MTRCLLPMLLLTVCGCASQRVVQVAEREAEPAAGGRWEVIGTSVEGREIRAWRGGAGSRRVLLLGGIHGSEPAGADLVDGVAHDLESRPELLKGAQVLAVPVVNPDGLVAGRRTNANGIDLNRNFPSRNFRVSALNGHSPSSEPETCAMVSVLETFRPDVIVTVHAPMACVDYDGPALALASRMSTRCNLPVKKLGARSGSLGSWAGLDRGIPTITLELPPDDPDPRETLARFGPALLEALQEGR